MFTTLFLGFFSVIIRAIGWVVSYAIGIVLFLAIGFMALFVYCFNEGKRVRTGL